MTKQQQYTRALDKAISGQSFSNYPAIIQGFIDKGIPEDQIMPRENVFTYKAWKALKRQVRRGEHGVRVCTYIELPEKRNDKTGEVTDKARSMPRMTTVFHVSQTDPVQ